MTALTKVRCTPNGLNRGIKRFLVKTGPCRGKMREYACSEVIAVEEESERTNRKKEYTLVLIFAKDGFEEPPVESAVDIIRCLPEELDSQIERLRLGKTRGETLKKDAYRRTAAEIIVLSRGIIVRRIKKIYGNQQ